MPTIRAKYEVTLKFEVEISRDFDLSENWQIAEQLYGYLDQLDPQEATWYLLDHITKIGKGKPVE